MQTESLASIGQLYGTIGETARSSDVLARAYEHARTSADPAVRAKTTCEYGTAVVRSGDAVRARALVAEGLAALPDDSRFSLARMSCHMSGSSVENWAGGGDASIAHAQAAREAAEQSGALSPLIELKLTMNLAEAYRIAGRYADADVAFRDAVKRAEDRGVTICFEPLSPAETNFINTAAAAIEFVKPFKSPAFQIILDVKAMCSEAKPLPQIIRESWPHFAHFHANDKNLKGPGFGDVDFKPIAATLREVGYGGYVSVEVFKFEEGPEVIASQSIEYLRTAFQA